jgi:hypothetical protein
MIEREYPLCPPEDGDDLAIGWIPDRQGGAIASIQIYRIPGVVMEQQLSQFPAGQTGALWLARFDDKY